VEIIALCFTIISIVGLYRDRKTFLMVSFILLAIELVLLVITFGILIFWAAENTYECSINECYTCEDETASYICSSFMIEAELNCWLYQSSYQFYCFNLVVKMLILCAMIWFQLVLIVMCCAFMLGTVSTIFQYTSYTSASTQTEYRRLSTDADWTSHLNTEQLPEDVAEESFPETDSEFPEEDSEIPEL